MNEKIILLETPVSVKLQLIANEPDLNNDVWYETQINGTYINNSGSYNKELAQKRYERILQKYNRVIVGRVRVSS